MKNLKMVEKSVKDLCRKEGKIQVLRNINMDMNVESTPVISIKINARLSFLICQDIFNEKKYEVTLYYHYIDSDYESKNEKYKYDGSLEILVLNDDGSVEHSYKNNEEDIDINFDNKTIEKLIDIMKRVREYSKPLLKLKKRI